MTGINKGSRKGAELAKETCKLLTSLSLRALRLGEKIISTSIHRMTVDRSNRRARTLELGRIEVVLVQQLVELGAIALGNSRRLADVATGNLQQLGEVFTFKS